LPQSRVTIPLSSSAPFLVNREYEHEKYRGFTNPIPIELSIIESAKLKIKNFPQSLLPT
jgi:hypothetical protein